MKILYLGATTGTAMHRANALVRLGHEVCHINPQVFVPKGRFVSKFHWETGGLFCQEKVTAGVIHKIGSETFDLVWVDGGRYVAPGLIIHLKKKSEKVINYNADNPYQRRDRFSWSLFRRAISFYDIIVNLREENTVQAKELGAKRTIRVYFSADEVAHAPRILTAQDHAKWDSEVAFIGTWFPERGPFLTALIQHGVPLSIYGSDWNKSPEWSTLKPFWKRLDANSEDDYAKKIQCSKVCLGLLSKGNRDLHTTRTMEIPYLGGLLCAEKTTEHLELYEEGKEAVFWSSPQECAQICFDLLKNEAKRQQIAHQGQLRSRKNGHLNERMMANVLVQVGHTSTIDS